MALLRARVAWAALAAVVFLAPDVLAGQTGSAMRAAAAADTSSLWAWATTPGSSPPFSVSRDAEDDSPRAIDRPQAVDPDRERAINTLLSLAVPGAGQLRSGHPRGWAYLAVEVLAWAGWAERRYRGRELQDRYRDEAWERARLQAGPRIDPDFDYYETLTKWTRSGGYDVDAAPGLQPEMDPSTYNGSIWALARGLFLPDGAPLGPSTPGWENALDYYRRRAWDDRFLWDWSSDPDARQEYADIIASSDDRFRQATHVLGFLIANHVVSGVDAYLSGGVGRAASSLRVHPVEGRGWVVSGRWDGLP